MMVGEIAADAIQKGIEAEADRVTDLHLRQLGPGHWAAVASLVSSDLPAPDVYKRRVAGIEGVSHLTVEVQPCDTRAEPVATGRRER